MMNMELSSADDAVSSGTPSPRLYENLTDWDCQEFIGYMNVLRGRLFYMYSKYYADKQKGNRFQLGEDVCEDFLVTILSVLLKKRVKFHKYLSEIILPQVFDQSQTGTINQLKDGVTSMSVALLERQEKVNKQFSGVLAINKVWRKSLEIHRTEIQCYLSELKEHVDEKKKKKEEKIRRQNKMLARIINCLILFSTIKNDRMLRIMDECGSIIFHDSSTK